MLRQSRKALPARLTGNPLIHPDKSRHLAAIICSDYQRSKSFYTEILGLKIIAENYRASRDSYKLDLALPKGKAR